MGGLDCIVSRTDKTKPWRVRVVEHRPVAEHHHPEGICDLPGSPLDETGLWSEHYCHWQNNIMWGPWRGSCCGGCGCRMCSGYWTRRWARRADRHQAQRDARALVKIARTPETEVDRAASSREAHLP